jgi:hypothetical protein
VADIQQIEQQVAQDEESVEVTIFQKDGSPYLAADNKTPATISVIGKESRRYTQALDALTRKMTRPGYKTTPESIRSNRIAVAAAAVVGWSGWEKDGKPWSCDPDNVRALLRAEHVLEQVEAGIAGHADFFAKRSQS